MDPNAYRQMAETEAHHWWFMGRRAILWSLISKLDLPDQARILEIGCGSGGNLELLSHFGDVQAMEMDDDARTIAQERSGHKIGIQSGSCPSDIPFENCSFDLVCLFDVLEHIDNDVDTLVAVNKLLCRGGQGLITVPAFSGLWSRHDEFLHHYRRYSAQELKQKLNAAGHEVERISYFNTLLFPLAIAARLIDRLSTGNSVSGTAIPSPFLNGVLYRIFRSEARLLQKHSFPLGLSLMATFRAK